MLLKLPKLPGCAVSRLKGSRDIGRKADPTKQHMKIICHIIVLSAVYFIKKKTASRPGKGEIKRNLALA